VDDKKTNKRVPVIAKCLVCGKDVDIANQTWCEDGNHAICFACWEEAQGIEHEYKIQKVEKHAEGLIINAKSVYEAIHKSKLKPMNIREITLSTGELTGVLYSNEKDDWSIFGNTIRWAIRNNLEPTFDGMDYGTESTTTSEPPTDETTTIAEQSTETVKVSARTGKTVVKPKLKAEQEVIMPAPDGLTDEERAEIALRDPSEKYEIPSPDSTKEEDKELFRAALKEINADARKLRKDLEESKFNSLSLPQIGIKKRMIALKYGGTRDIRVYTNPIVHLANNDVPSFVAEQIDESLPDETYLHLRHTTVEIDYLDHDGKAKTETLTGLAAAEAEKQCDRLMGIYLWDFGHRWEEEHHGKWQDLPEDERRKVIALYLMELQERSQEIDETVKKDPELKQMLNKMAKARKDLKASVEKAIKKNQEENKQKQNRAMRRRNKERSKVKPPWLS
jgi:peptide deformylase